MSTRKARGRSETQSRQSAAGTLSQSLPESRRHSVSKSLRQTESWRESRVESPSGGQPEGVREGEPQRLVESSAKRSLPQKLRQSPAQTVSNSLSEPESSRKSRVESPCRSQLEKAGESVSESPPVRQPEGPRESEPQRPVGSSMKRQGDREIIAYVHCVSPMKRNRKNTMNYCNLKVQTDNDVKPAVCFSRAKRSLLVDRAVTKTAVKLEKFNVSKDGKTIFINDMTRVSSPNALEYDFQHRDFDNSATCLKSVAEKAVDMDVVNITAKVISKESEATVVGASNLKKSECYIADESCTMKLILWEKNIEEVSVGEVYVFKSIRVRGEEAESKVLNTTMETVIEEKVDSELKHLVVSEIPLPDSTSANSTLNVDLIHSVEELSRFKQCSHCSKKIIQDTCSLIVKCDHCGHVVRSSSCKVNVIVKFTVEKSDVPKDSDDKFLRFVMFKEVLEKIVGGVENLQDDCIFERLLSLKNFDIIFNAEHVVKDATLQR